MKPHLLGICIAIVTASFATNTWSLGAGTQNSTATLAPIPSNPEAGTKGMYGPVIKWPVIPIHMTLLPNGNVLSFGTNQVGQQRGLINAIWNPSLGTDSNAHTITPNPLHTDTFCAGQTVISSTGETLVAGGDATINGKRNYSSALTNFFDSNTNVLTQDTPMTYKRWYPTLVALANGDVVILGGRDEKTIPTFASMPEAYTPGVGFRTLPGAVSEDAYGKNTDSWRYPRGFLAPNGKVFIISHREQTFWLDPTGDGSISTAGVHVPKGAWGLPTLMYAPGKILSIREDKRAVVFDLNGNNVTTREVAGITALRRWSSTTVLADGKVLLNGGSEVPNSLKGVVDYHNEIWDPATEQWTIGASAVVPRLYHSNSLLMPDGTVLTGGGGAPGPLKNLNAEIFYPPYLYKHDGSGAPADRPSVDTAPDSLVWNQAFSVSYTSSTPVSRVTFIRSGSATHSLNNDQRYMELPFSQAEGSSNTINVTGPTDRNLAPPGYYMMFIFDQDGVPSIAKLIHLQD